MLVRRPDNSYDNNCLDVRVVLSSLLFLLGHLAAEVAARLSLLLGCFQRLTCAVGQPFHDVTFTAMKCTCSMYVVKNGCQKLALLQISCACGNTLRECKMKVSM